MSYAADSPLLGAGIANADAIQAWFASHGTPPPVLGAVVVFEANAAGLNADLVAAQIAHETGYWTSDWALHHDNPAGIGVTGAPGVGLSFPSIQAGVHAQVAHLLSYILGSSNPLRADDPRYAALPASLLGSVHALADLDGRWAVPGAGYGEALAQLGNQLVATVSAPATIDGIPVVQRPAAAGNYDSNRTAYDLIIVHDIEGTAAGAIARFQTPGQQASVQYVLDPGQGRIVQMVSDADVAYGCGNYACNQKALQFEMPGYTGQPYDPGVIDYAVSLTRYLVSQYGIPPVRLSLADVVAGQRGICGHQDIPDPANPSLGGGADHHTDPGPTFPWSDFLARVTGIPAVTAPDSRTFPNGFTSGGGFFQYWSHYGGLEAFGMPISHEYDTTGWDGKPVRRQWYERAVFEWRQGQWPDHWDTLPVLLGDLIRDDGSDLTALAVDATQHAKEFVA